MAPILEEFKTRRLVMRKVSEAMIPGLVELYHLHAWELMKKRMLPACFEKALEAGLVGHGSRGPSDAGSLIGPDNVREWIALCNEYWDSEDRYTWGMALRKNREKPVGVLQFAAEDHDEKGKITRGGFSFWLGTQARRQGLMSEALQGAMKILHRHGVRTADIAILPDDRACLRLARRLGFRKTPIESGSHLELMNVVVYSRKLALGRE
jgi:RimJ/RimL family protein N-acetyltransferase